VGHVVTSHVPANHTMSRSGPVVVNDTAGDVVVLVVPLVLPL
jgi:hypothetical protein